MLWALVEAVPPLRKVQLTALRSQVLGITQSLKRPPEDSSPVQAQHSCVTCSSAQSKPAAEGCTSQPLGFPCQQATTCNKAALLQPKCLPAALCRDLCDISLSSTFLISLYHNSDTWKRQCPTLDPPPAHAGSTWPGPAPTHQTRCPSRSPQ